MNDISLMKDLIAKIKKADEEYYGNNNSTLSDREYDALVQQLSDLEKKTGMIFANSPTQKVAGATTSVLKQVPHTVPMLSVQKTKSLADFDNFVDKKKVVMSWKLDGLTLVLRYHNGQFQQALTRGVDGLIGEDVTHTVKYFSNIPQTVSYKKDFEVRGEGVMSWRGFDVLGKIAGESHPRNIASGCVRAQLPDRNKLSKMDFVAFEVIGTQLKTKIAEFAFMTKNGFKTVPYKVLEEDATFIELKTMVDSFDADNYEYPVDGIVCQYDDLVYGNTLGANAHHKKSMMALKWQDELVETIFRSVDLVTGRTGEVSIVANFDPVTVCGTTVKRANLHNYGLFEKLQLGVGDRIQIYKANMIIPQIAENLTKSGTYNLPMVCPSCGAKLQVKVSPSGAKELYCPNNSCIARHARKLARYCDKTAMDIEGLTATMIEELMEHGFIKKFSDLYHLGRYRNEIAALKGWGYGSINTIQEQVEKSRHTSLARFLIGIGIPMLGPQAAMTLEDYYEGSFEKFEEDIKKDFPFDHIKGIKPALSRSIHAWYRDPVEEGLWRPLLQEVTFTQKMAIQQRKLKGIAGKHIAVTGALNMCERDQFIALLGKLGATYASTVSAKCDLLVVGTNPGSKLAKAIALGVKIVNEEQFAQELGEQ